MKRFAGILLLILAGSVSVFAIEPGQPAQQHFHAHVITHVAKYSYKTGRAVVREVAKPVVYVTKQVV
ncbi:MAG: hypothetical protein WA532_02440 [Candidatus Korobacteraceae bacterium]